LRGEEENNFVEVQLSREELLERMFFKQEIYWLTKRKAIILFKVVICDGFSLLFLIVCTVCRRRNSNIRSAESVLFSTRRATKGSTILNFLPNN
jgi:hypothetical protein